MLRSRSDKGWVLIAILTALLLAFAAVRSCRRSTAAVSYESVRAEMEKERQRLLDAAPAGSDARRVRQALEEMKYQVHVIDPRTDRAVKRDFKKGFSRDLGPVTWDAVLVCSYDADAKLSKVDATAWPHGL